MISINFTLLIIAALWYAELIFALEHNTADSLAEDCPNPSDFRCSREVCINGSYVCDGKYDCPNKSDEDDCDFKTCKAPAFYQCKNDRCISSNLRCDGHYDCNREDDEDDCSNYVPYHENVTCSKNEFLCVLDNMCIPLELVCDKVEQCMDGSDETDGCRDIEQRCKGFLCKNKNCITDKDWICDGQNDCGDNSDEDNCPAQCTVQQKKFMCADNKTCIPIEKVCNKFQDCPDNSDEIGECSNYKNNTNCKPTFCPTNAECFIWPKGPVCVCPVGFEYNPRNQLCQDIDECQTYGICSQGCINTNGSYKCTCEKKFKLKNDLKSCEIVRGDPLMVYSGKDAIHIQYLRSRSHREIKHYGQAVGIGYDGAFVFWTDTGINTQSINKAKLDGTRKEVILTNGIFEPEDIDLDWLTGNIYFTDSRYMHIAVCSESGLNCLPIVNEVQKPRGLALYPQEGRMYYTDWGARPLIGVANMDGTDNKAFVTDKIYWPNGITLDWPNERVYWVDGKYNTIESIRFDGKDRTIVIGNVLKHPYGITVFENNIYWSDWDTKSIQTCNKFNCKKRETVAKDRKIYDLHIYHAAKQPSIKHACETNKCSHICLLSSNETYSCLCPTDMKLNKDLFTCSHIVKPQQLIIGVRNYLIFLEHQSFGRHREQEPEILKMYIHKMAFNSLNGHIFVADNTYKIIYDVDMTDTNITEIVSSGIGKISSLAFDPFGNNLYWTDSERCTVEILSLSTNHRALVSHFSFTNIPISLALVPKTGYMYVALKTFLGAVHIDMLAMHGRGAHIHKFENDLGDGDIQFAVDEGLQEIFWSDSNKNQISFTNYEGTMYHQFITNIASPSSVAVLENDIFWSTPKSFDIYWAPKHNLGLTKKMTLVPPEFTSHFNDIVLITSTPILVVEHICQKTNGKCSHVCVSLGPEKSACLCPPGLIFKDLKNETCIESSECEFKCDSGECLKSSQKCDNHQDCVDGSDENNCTNKFEIPSQKTCNYDEFRCTDGTQCIPQSEHCDHNFDCKDRSDEESCNSFNHTTKCHENQHACSDGLCLDVTALCDGFNDCNDGSDELKCNYDRTTNYKCDATMFTCTSGQCVPLSWVCDEEVNCKDGSDEHNCPDRTCPQNYAKCRHGQCIDKALLCNGVNNCGDNSDELNCEKNKANIVCGEEDATVNGPKTKFQCSSNRTICLPLSAKCNGIDECPRGEDEADCSGCRVDQFECKNKKCIELQWKCDKMNDCGDKSDEENCQNTNDTIWHAYSDICHDGMFDCKDGHCIDMSKVCNGEKDCPNNYDEADECSNACKNNPCSDICNKTPMGPICSCREGYGLDGDKKTCVDIDECKLYNPCSQQCENTIGSFRCSCFLGYMLKSDKVSCKSMGSSKHLLYSSYNTIFNISQTTLGIVINTNSSKIIGLDMNMPLNLLYFTVEDSDTLYELNITSQKLNTVSKIGSPTKLSVDWANNNVYFVDQSSTPSIKICHLSNKACIQIIQLKYKDLVKSIAVDSINNQLFYTILHYWTFSISESFIYKQKLDGTKSEVLLSGSNHIADITYDANKKIVYYIEMSTNSIWSIRYDGSDKRILFKEKSSITKAIGINLFEDQLYINNLGSKMVAQCKVYGNRECRTFDLDAYNVENVKIVQDSVQKNVENICDGVQCQAICVAAEKGAKCLCNGGSFVKPEEKCQNIETNEVSISPQFSTSTQKTTSSTTSHHHSTVGKVFSALSIILVLTLLIAAGYYGYRKRVFHKKFNVSMHFQNPSSSDHNLDNARVKMCTLPEVCTSNRFNEIFVNTDKSNSTERFVTNPLQTPLMEDSDADLCSLNETSNFVGGDSLKTKLIRPYV